MKPIFVAIFLALSAAPPAHVMFHYPRWSPDGKWLVFTTNIDGDDEVWVMSRDGSEKRRLTDNAVADANADWHPDGRRIVFQREAQGRIEHLVINLDGSSPGKYDPTASRPPRTLVVEERRTQNGQAVFISKSGAPGWRISHTAWAEQPSVSPDGTAVVFEQCQQPNDILSSEIAVWDLRNESVRPIARGTDPSWAPDSTSVLFKTPRGGDLVVALADLKTGAVRVIAPGVHPQFSPDGRWIAFMSNDSDRADIYVIGADGKGRACLTCDWK